MKPCEFVGWVEIEVGDPIAQWDVWVRPGRVPTDDWVADWRIGRILTADDLNDSYRLFRKVENVRIEFLKRVYKPNCSPLPLP